MKLTLQKPIQYGKRLIEYLRSFDYTDLSFLYVACLVTIALVYSIFRVSQYYLSRQEHQALSAIQQMGRQRELVSELERLIAFTQNRTTPQYPVTARLLIETYGSLVDQHRGIAPELEHLRGACVDRPCAAIFNPNFFRTAEKEIERNLSGNKLSGRTHNAFLQSLFDQAVRYHIALKDMLALSFDLIQTKRRTTMTFDVVAYFSLIALLLLQALYVFRPAIRRLNESLASRSNFMSRISHEIRNPMNSIIGMADILKTTKLNSEQQHYVDNLIRSGHALLDMLNNLIDSSALERGKLSLKPQPFNLYKSIDRCLNLVAIQAHHKNINLHLHMTPDVPARLIGDSVRLEQVLINLLNNAVKFTEQGFVRLDISKVRDGVDHTELRFEVADTGIGIKHELLGQIFESFVQADSGIQRKYGGSGLGLSIASELIRMMEGELHVRSEYGQGSKFYFNIVLRNGPSRKSGPSLAGLTARRFIFLISYAESSAYQEFFAKVGARAALLHSSQDLRQLIAGGMKGEVDEILVDDSIGIISMITCRNLAEEAGLGDRVVALIRSGFTKENMDLLKRNGFKRFLTKPLKPWDLLELPPSRDSESLQPAFTPNADVVNKLKEKNLRVLLVDDSNDNLFLLKEVINPWASVVHFAENGLEALEKFTRNSYDVVFMDIQMPVMDGYTAIRKIREVEMKSGRSVPVYAVTAHAGLVDAQKCREAGFTDRIVKPVVRSDIYLSLSKAFKIDVGGLDFQEATGMPAKYLVKLMPGFLKTRGEDMNKLRAAVAQENFDQIGSLGHKMKGSSASYGFKEASELSLRLERAAKAKDLSLCVRLAEDLDHTFQEIAAEFPTPPPNGAPDQTL